MTQYSDQPRKIIMTEANSNANSVDSQSSVDFSPTTNKNDIKYQDKVKDITSKTNQENFNLTSDNFSKSSQLSTETEQNLNDNDASVQNMNWQKVAHKLREYNRKLLKKVFRLEQELAEIDNRFNKHIEKSQNSDLLVAQQAEEIRKSQEKIALLSQQAASSQQQVQTQEIEFSNISQQLDLSQQQSAQLERECTLLQENYDRQTFELVAKEKEIKELQTRLTQQQRYAMQYKAELKHYQEKAAPSQDSSKREKVTNNYRNSISSRSIKPWSTSSSNTKISLPQTKPQSNNITRVVAKATETVKTAAEISSWSASTPKQKEKTVSGTKSTAKSGSSKKPKSLAAIDLPTFPRQG